MFNFLRKILPPSTYLGVDIGTTSLKVAEIKKSGQGKPELLNYGYLESLDYLERANAAFQTSTLRVEEESLAKFLRALMKQSGIAPAPVVGSISAFSVFSTLIEVPALPDEDIKKSMPLQAKQYVPMPINEVALDWMKVGERVAEDGSRMTQILLISIPVDIIARYDRIFKAAKLELSALEVESVSMARSLTLGAPDPVLLGEKPFFRRFPAAVVALPDRPWSRSAQDQFGHSSGYSTGQRPPLARKRDRLGPRQS